MAKSNRKSTRNIAAFYGGPLDGLCRDVPSLGNGYEVDMRPYYADRFNIPKSLRERRFVTAVYEWEAILTSDDGSLNMAVGKFKRWR